VTRIPEEHHAARELERRFRELGEARAARRRPVRLPARRTLVLAIVAVLLLAAAAGGAGLFSFGGGSVPQPEKLPKGVARAPRDIALAGARAKDPLGSWTWGMRRYTSRTGASCVVVGRMREGQLVRPNGAGLVALPPTTPGSCGRLDAEPALIALRIYGTISGARSVLYGLVDRTVRALRLVEPGGKERSVPVAADGSYLVVLVGQRAFRGADLEVVRAGSIQRHRLLP
jgi:hypothetical protein